MIKGVLDMKNKMNAVTEQVFDKMASGMEQAMTEMETTAKKTAPWMDRTGNARNSITGSGVERDKSTMRIGLAIGVEYGKWLELLHGGKYRIVWPTIEWMGNKLPSYWRF